MPSKDKIKKDGSTEEKIKEAARKLFTHQGFAATKTRDIANEAGINIALLNYYFRSKEKLFEIIVHENMHQFMQVISEIVNNEQTTIEEKIEVLVSNYIDMLMRIPDMPLFVMNNLKNNPERMKMRQRFIGSYFMKQVEEAIKSGKIASMSPFNIMLNIVGLTIFPFIARPMFCNSGGMTPEQFNSLMMERKKLIPEWIKIMLELKK